MSFLDHKVPRRLFYAALLVAASAGLALAASRGTDHSETSPATGAVVTALLPAPGSQALRQSTVGVQLGFGYAANLTINGTPIPADQLNGNTELGQYYFQPGEGKVIEALPGGENCAVATFWRHADGAARAETTSWCFSAT